MLSFFRKIRRSLIESGSARRYILYAIGEIVLVMVGILLALQVNNWNEWKKDRIREGEILQSLEDNFELNIHALETDIKNLTELNQSAKIAISVLDERLPFSDTLGIHFHNVRIPKNQLSISQSGYEQYKNIGYDIILNDNLKKEVINFFESTLSGWQSFYDEVNYKNLSFDDYHVPLFHFKNISLEPIDIESLYTDQYYLGWIKAYTGGRKILIQMEQNFIEENQRVLQIIKDELKNRK